MQEEEEEEANEEKEEVEQEENDAEQNDGRKDAEMEELEKEYLNLRHNEQDLLKSLKRHKDEDLLKGQAVKNQKALWDKSLEFRFLLQKAFSSSNRLPQEPLKASFCSDQVVNKAYSDLIISSQQTLDSLLELQEALLEKNPSIASVTNERLMKVAHHSGGVSEVFSLDVELERILQSLSRVEAEQQCMAFGKFGVNRNCQVQEDENGGGIARARRSGTKKVRLGLPKARFRQVYSRRERSQGRGASVGGVQRDRCAPRLKSIVINSSSPPFSDAANVPIGSFSSRGEFRLLRRRGSEVNWDELSEQDGVGVQAASLIEPGGSSQLVSRVNDLVEEESGSSDEEGLWRMQGAESDVEVESSAEEESGVAVSTTKEAEEGVWTRREVLTNVAKSVEGGERAGRPRRKGGGGVWGGGRGERRLDVRGLLRKLKPDLIAIQETKLEVLNDAGISELWEYRQVDWVTVNSVGASRGQLVMWDRLVFEKIEVVSGEFSISIRSTGHYSKGSETYKNSDVEGDEEWLRIYQMHSRIAPFRDNSVDKWQRKTQVATGAAAIKGKLHAFNQNISEQVAAFMRDPSRMIKRMQLRGSTVGIFGSVPDVVADNKEEVPDVADDNKEEDAHTDGDPELLDDSEFYQQLLKEFFETFDPASSETAFYSLKRLQTKKRKIVDRRASKSRKIRYHVHEKMVNFMAPQPREIPPMAPKLFENLFGLKSQKLASGA
ncbi:hypothetical protein HHK36_028039 [Tetracentron sinense]|uniref:Protein AATF n=1 Tax=Tetracentron sinense TaxID=13715 RepID=A0A834YJ63_TETSI|nr:hypothetical protein HHK36_028039 [Tetracentron sinense]